MIICKNVDNTVRWSQGERLNHLFEQRCDQVPEDHPAIITEDNILTFRELDVLSNQTARYLLSQGLKAGDRIALLFDKSSYSYIGLLAVLKIGAAYVPLDAAFPVDRIAFILEDADVKKVLSVSRYSNNLSDFDGETIMIDRLQAEIRKMETDRLHEDEVSPSADQLFYIIYTSGTTGKPKGVAIEHAGICNFVKVACEVYGITEQDRCYQGMTLAFDFHVESLWVPLIGGATLISGKSGASLFGNDLHEFLSSQHVTVLPCVPTLLATIEKDLPEVRIILLSGESVPHNLVVRWHRHDRYILNAYGPTECSVSSTLRRLMPENRVTIGVPLPTYTAVILNEHKDEIVRDGEIGEIGIAGVALAVGYVNREELTHQKFIHDFLDIPNNPSKRIYRTGDYGKISDDGELEFHGRIDTQVKLRGYRIELGEIEAVLQKLPEISQAVVNACEATPGAVDLVAYYTRTYGAGEVSHDAVSALLRKNLPAYMVPDYLEELSEIPMTTNHKADRKALPPPKGPRFTASTKDFVEPTTETEKVVADVLIDVMKLTRASAQEHFFEDLGAHSLLMARFGAEIRKRLNIPSVSMRDIYLNPTIQRFAQHIDSLSADSAGQPATTIERDTFHEPSDFSYYSCGLAQLAWFVGWGILITWVLETAVQWSYAAMPDLWTVYWHIIAAAIAFCIIFSVIPIAAKWLLIGKWKPQTIPIWSRRYFRFWAVKTLIKSAPMAAFGGPLYTLYLRLLGAKIGVNTVIQSRGIPICTDLISIGDNTALSSDSIILGYTARDNRIHTGTIHIGSNAFVGEAGVLDINTVMEDDTQLGTASSLHEGQRIPKGKHFHGSPSRETDADYCPIKAMRCSSLRRWVYAGVNLILFFGLLPFPTLLLYHYFPNLVDYLGDPFESDATGWDLMARATSLIPLSLAIFIGGVILALLFIGIVPRILNLALQKDKVYVLYGFHYFVHRLIVRTSNSVFFNRLFGDSSAIVYYARWIGYRLNKVIQTGSNFGMTQRHENPFLVDIGSGTMVSGGLKIVNETISASSFKIGEVKIGERTYLGNYLHIPVDAKVGANVLLGTKMLVPINGPILENTGLLGSPSFAIPRATDRDIQMSNKLMDMDEGTRKQRLKAKNRYNTVTAIVFLFIIWVDTFAASLFSGLSSLYYPKYGLLAALAAVAGSFVFAVLWFFFVERASLKFGKLEPKIVPLLDNYFWFHERVWKLTALWLFEPALAGTPFKNLLSRMQGIKVGRKIFDDGCDCDECSLIEIGDYANLNAASNIQPHSLEEGVFKSGRVRIGKGCTLGCAANLNYDVCIGDYAHLAPNSFLMKGEIVDARTYWEGNPAQSIGNINYGGVASGE